LLEKWRNKFNEDDDIITFLRVLTGDVDAIQKVMGFQHDLKLK